MMKPVGTSSKKRIINDSDMQIVDYEWKPAWEEVRINAAINALSAIILREYPLANGNPREAAKCAVVYADELVEELKKGGKE